MIAGLAFGAYMAWYAYRSGGLAQLGRSQRPQGQVEDLGAPGRGEGAVAKLEGGHGGALDHGQGGVGADDGGAVRAGPG